MQSNTMNAISFSTYGDAEVLQLSQHPIPTLTANGVRIKVIAAGINPADTAIRRGTFRLLIRLKFPFIPGSDLAGIVTDVGQDVQQVKPGDTVYAMLPTGQGGAYAEYIVIEENLIATMPTDLTFTQAAGVPLAALTALQALRDKANLSSGQTVLVYGASGGVGSFAVQIAQALGATVTGVCSTRNIERVQELGVQSVIDYTQQSLSELDQQYDVVLDAVAKLPLRTALRLARPGGKLVSLNPGMNNPVSKLYARLFGRRLAAVMVKPDQPDLQQITGWIDEAKITPVIDKLFPLTDAIAAHQYSETQRACGKLILQIDSNLADETPKQTDSILNIQEG